VSQVIVLLQVYGERKNRANSNFVYVHKRARSIFGKYFHVRTTYGYTGSRHQLSYFKCNIEYIVASILQSSMLHFFTFGVFGIKLF